MRAEPLVALEELFMEAALPALLVGRDGALLQLNHAARHLFVAAPQRLEQLTDHAAALLDLAHGDERCVLYSKQGAFDGQIVPLRDLEGRCVGLLGVCADVTQQLKEMDHVQRAQQVSSAVIRRYEGLLDGVEDAIFSYDRRLMLIAMNTAARRFVGVADEALLGRHLHDAFPGTRDSMFETAYRGFIATGISQRFDYHDAPNERWLQLHIQPTAAAAGEREAHTKFV